MSHRDRKPENREPPVIAGRVPPNDLDAEAAVLASALLDEASLDVVLETVEDSWFYSGSHKLISEAMRRLRGAGQAVDIVTVASELRDREQIQAAGGAGYLGQLVDATPAIAHLEDYCGKVGEYAQRRRVIAAGQLISAEGYGDVGDHQKWISEVEGRFFEATTRKTKREPKRIGELVAAEYRAIQDPDAVPTEKVSTLLKDFDADIGGLYRGELHIIAGRPGMGKTALASVFARNIAGQRDEDGEFLYEVPLFSLEMPKQQVGQRFLAQEAGVSLTKIRDRGRLKPISDSDHSKLVSAAAALDHVPLHVDDTPGISVAAIVSRLRRFDSAARKRGRRLGAVVVDYLQKVTVGKVGYGKRDEIIGSICNDLKNVAMELDVPVLLLSQLNRSLESRPRDERQPRLSDLRESGNIEQDADLVIFVYREGYYSRSAEQKTGEIIVGKNRMGPKGTVPIGWWGWCTRFLNVEDA